ncbi:MAG: peptidase MA family metallohydrolase [Chloroflexota bacterium]
MGRLTRALAVLALLLGALVAPPAARGFSGFGATSADATFDEAMTFRVELSGGAPEQLEILLQFADDDATFVAPVRPAGDTATFTWDAASDFIVPNTLVTYRWRAIVDGEPMESAPAQLLYDDDRDGLDWHEREMGRATVHWYGSAEDAAVRFGELSADGATQAEELLGADLAGPIDIFVYDSEDDFFGALGPGAREWTGAAAYPNLRTVFMWLGGGPQDYLETAIVHEVTHVVFHDATANPFHQPAQWLNEGLATWAENRNADSSRSTVEFEASGAGLLAFDAITQAFPISDRGAALAYSEGTVMVDRIISEHGEGAIAAIAAAYRDGATDAEAIEAGIGVAADELYAAFYADFGADAPRPVAPSSLGDSDVPLPGGGLPSPEPGSSGGGVPVDERPDGAPAERGYDASLLFYGLGVMALVVAGGVLVIVARGARRQPPEPPDA